LRRRPESELPARLIPQLAYLPLGEMVKLPLVAEASGAAAERHRKSIEILRERSESREGVIFLRCWRPGIWEATTNSFRICCIRKALFRERERIGRCAQKLSLGTNP